MKLWKPYFYFMVALFIFGLASFIAEPRLKRLADVAINIISLTALYGFVFNKEIFIKKFWKISFIVCVLVEISTLNETIGMPASFFIFTSIIIIPIYVAMFLYAFKRKP